MTTRNFNNIELYQQLKKIKKVLKEVPWLHVSF